MSRPLFDALLFVGALGIVYLALTLAPVRAASCSISPGPFGLVVDAQGVRGLNVDLAGFRPDAPVTLTVDAPDGPRTVEGQADPNGTTGVLLTATADGTYRLSATDGSCVAVAEYTVGPAPVARTAAPTPLLPTIPPTDSL